MNKKPHHAEIEEKIVIELIAVYAILALMLTGIYYFEPSITGFAVLNTTNETQLNQTNIETIINESIGIPSSAFVSVCRWEQVGGFVKCEVGKIFASGRGLE